LKAALLILRAGPLRPNQDEPQQREQHDDD
jgi:hypothetical protein